MAVFADDREPRAGDYDIYFATQARKSGFSGHGRHYGEVLMEQKNKVTT